MASHLAQIHTPPMPPPPLLGTYAAPRVRIGRRVHCRFRRTTCRVTSHTDAPIPWPRVQSVGRRGGSGLWVNAELARAIRTESAAALRHWWGVSPSAARALRRWAGAHGHTGTPGTRRAVKAAADLGGEATRGTELDDEACELRATNSKRLNLIRHAQAKRWPDGWTAEMDALLGTMSDGEVARRVGKSRAAVQARRVKLGVAAAE